MDSPVLLTQLHRAIEDALRLESRGVMIIHMRQMQQVLHQEVGASFAMQAGRHQYLPGGRKPCLLQWRQ